VDTVLVDNFQGAHLAVEHLLEQGGRRIAILNGSERFAAHQDRYRGYEAALRRAGVDIDPELVLHAGRRTAGTEEALLRAFSGPTPPDALFIANNQLTVRALPILDRLGIRIPDDLLLVCFDDLPLSTVIGQGLTVVEQPTYELGTRAATFLLQRIEDPDTPIREHMLSPRLIVRGSSMAQRPGRPLRPGPWAVTESGDSLGEA
jgi:LacI family transcriptional regulator